MREVDFVFGEVTVCGCDFALLLAVAVLTVAVAVTGDVVFGERGGCAERAAFASCAVFCAVRTGGTAFLFGDVVTPFSYEFGGEVGDGGVGMGAGAVDDDTDLGGAEEVFVGSEVGFEVIEDGQDGAWRGGGGGGFL